MAHGSDASKLIRVKHTKDVLENLANIREVMDLANAEFEATAEQYRRLARKSINQADLRKYVKRVLKIEDEEGPQHPQPEHHGGDRPAGRDGPGQRPALRPGHALDGLQRRIEWLTYNRGRSERQPAELALVR